MEFINKVAHVLHKNWVLWRADTTPAFVRDGQALAARLALLGAAMLACVLLVQILLRLVRRKWKGMAGVCIVCALCVGVCVWAALPVDTVPNASVVTVLAQEKTAAEMLAEADMQTAASAAASDDVSAAGGALAVQGNSAVSDAASASAADSDASAPDAAGSDAALSASLGQAVPADTAVNPEAVANETDAAASSQEAPATGVQLSDEHVQSLMAALARTRCVRSLRRALPAADGYNLIFTRADGSTWQLFVTEKGTWRYDEGNFICRLQDDSGLYDTVRDAVQQAQKQQDAAAQAAAQAVDDAAAQAAASEAAAAASSSAAQSTAAAPAA